MYTILILKNIFLTIKIAFLFFLYILRQFSDIVNSDHCYILDELQSDIDCNPRQKASEQKPPGQKPPEDKPPRTDTPRQ